MELKDYFLKVIENTITAFQLVNDDDPVLLAGKEVCASSLSNVMKAFVEWSKDHTYHNKITGLWETIPAEVRSKKYSFDELFAYFITEIYKK